MRSVGIKALKNDLSRHLRAAEAGETVQVTDRGRVIAQIVPPATHRGKRTPEQRWRDLIREGIVTEAKRGHPWPPKAIPCMTFAELMADLAADREDG
jgi:antitoxin (DNA-binding transcriptional repressor) of toxin-antitoxin stability system